MMVTQSEQDALCNRATEMATIQRDMLARHVMGEIRNRNALDDATAEIQRLMAELADERAKDAAYALEMAKRFEQCAAKERATEIDHAQEVAILMDTIHDLSVELEARR